MKYKFKIVIPAILVFILFSSYTSIDPGVDSNKNQVLLKIIIQSLNQGHYQSQVIDDNFSNKVFKHYLNQIDGSKKFLIQSDIQKLRAHQNDLDDQINDANYDFFKLSESLMNKRIAEVGQYYKEILSKPFDFSKDETIEFDTDKVTYPKNEADSKEVWRKYLKYRTLFTLHNLVESEEKKAEKDDTYKKRTFADLEAKARKSVRQNQDEWFDRMLKIEENDWLSIYLNSITTLYDPHTTYFPPQDKENFDIEMSGKLEGIGARLNSKDGYITVVEIIPGSACWRQGELSAGDKILKVGQGSDEPVDVVDMRRDHAVKLIRGKKGTEVRLTVQKLNSSIVVIPIVRDVVIIEETYAKSAVINEVGYINLPKFYADFNGSGGRDCSEDVKKEIAKLKAENVKGIVLDLRDNGGGSLQDVVEMAGLFIKEGPIVQIKAKVGNPRVLYDTDEKIHYDGPLVVMVNSYSASASEILAAAMQDYGRAVIVGSSPTTFGKGTVQRAFDLDRFISEDYSDIKPLGALKLTLQKFYRIDGGATQLKGVTPDVILPDTRTYMDIGEKEQDFPIPWDEIGSLDFEKWDRPIANLEKIKKQSIERTRDNETFLVIDEGAKLYKDRQGDKLYPLNFKKYKTKLAQINTNSDKYENIFKEIDGINVSFPKEDIAKIQSDSISMKKMERWEKALKKDIYINEAINIIDDMM